MSDDFRRIWEQQETLRRIMDPSSDLRKHVGLHKELEIDSVTMDLMRQEKERLKRLADVMGFDSVSKLAKEFENQRKLGEQSIEVLKRIGLLDPNSDIRKSANATREMEQAYANLFRLPETVELSRIAHEAMERSKLARSVFGTEDRLQMAMASMRSPWLQIDESMVSAKAFSDIMAMGRSIENKSAFDHDLALALRSPLGDWRDLLTPTSEQLIDPLQRSGFYVERGFDHTLTDFTPEAFNESLRIAGLREQEETISSDEQEDGFARAKEAFDQLQRFEVELRRFIERVMHAAFGNNWMKQQLPANMLDIWIEKRDKAVNAGYIEQPLIDYADFTDYRAIIERTDNWNKVFKPTFKRVEDVRESFQRLFPVRITTMHARPITQDDKLLLLVETKRILKAIRS